MGEEPLCLAKPKLVSSSPHPDAVDYSGREDTQGDKEHPQESSWLVSSNIFARRSSSSLAKCASRTRGRPLPQSTSTTPSEVTMSSPKCSSCPRSPKVANFHTSPTGSY